MDTSRQPEEWRAVPGYEGRYEASSHGRVRGLTRTVIHQGGYSRRIQGRILALTLHKKTGYLVVALSKDGRSRVALVHHVIAAAFYGGRPSATTQIRHLDGDRLNNNADNLAYGTAVENAHDAIRHGTHWQLLKTHCPQGHEYTPENTGYRHSKSGTGISRWCKACALEKNRRVWEAQKAWRAANDPTYKPNPKKGPKHVV